MKRFILLAFAVLASGCASWRWSGGGPEPAAPPAPELAVSTAPARARPQPLPASSEHKERTALFYSDLGPDELDLSDYPLQQRHNYRVYERACSRCHDLGRSLWAPYADRRWWSFYVASMRVRAAWKGPALTREEVDAVLDFLDYDGRERKIRNARRFERQTDELRARFDALVEKRMEALQRGAQPPLIERKAP